MRRGRHGTLCAARRNLTSSRQLSSAAGFLLAAFFLVVLAVQDLPLPAPGWHLAGQRGDLAPHRGIDAVVGDMVQRQHPLDLPEREPFVLALGEALLAPCLD